MPSEPNDVPVSSNDNLEPQSPLIAISGRRLDIFWRRVAALLLDGLLLGLIGIIAGSVMFDWFASLGGTGRLVGFGVALIYFGLFNSAICGGQTPGKRLMAIEVVDRSGNHVTLGRSGGRFLILGTPFFLNGAITSVSWVGYLAGFVILGGGGAIIYLFLFNRRTRQSLHDLLCGTFVVKKADGGAVCAPPIWRIHFAILAALFATMLVVPLFASRLASLWKFPELLALREKILATDKFSDAGVIVGKHWSIQGGARHDVTYLALTVRLKQRPSEYESSARQVAALALTSYPDCKSQEVLAVTVTYGYDIGIARAWRNQHFQFSPAEWEQKIAEQK